MDTDKVVERMETEGIAVSPEPVRTRGGLQGTEPADDVRQARPAALQSNRVSASTDTDRRINQLEVKLAAQQLGSHGAHSEALEKCAQLMQTMAKLQTAQMEKANKLRRTSTIKVVAFARG